MESRGMFNGPPTAEADPLEVFWASLGCLLGSAVGPVSTVLSRRVSPVGTEEVIATATKTTRTIFKYFIAVPSRVYGGVAAVVVLGEPTSKLFVSRQV